MKFLHLENSNQYRTGTTALNWPLRAATGFTDCGYYAITAHVDHNPAAGAYKDYNCGTIAYDTHKGTDIAVYPFSFYKMDNNQVEVIAAAAGTIIAKSDGNFDRNCSVNNLTANYIIIQHADNSRALYWHLKKNSLTLKSIGQTVSEGEFLGVVGSSGSSSGPHLHFEVWSGSTSSTVIDPFAGTCNTLNTTSWWAAQKPYTEPAILKASVHTTDAVFPGCPTTETLNESTTYTIPFQGPGLPAGYAKFYTFFRNETSGMVTNLSILNPNGSTFSSWSQTSNATYNASYRSYSKVLPTIPGVYTFNATYNGATCSQSFTITNGSVATITASGSTTFCLGDSVLLTASSGSSYLWSNGLTTKTIKVTSGGNYSVTITYANSTTSTSPITTVTVNTLPVATITAGSATAFCPGDSVLLTSSTGNSYLWNNGLTTKTITVKSSGNYSVRVTGANGCSSTSLSKSITVNTPQNNLNIRLSNDTLYSPYGNKNFWFVNSGVNPLDSGLFYKCKQSGTYTVKGRDVNNCIATSNALFVNCSLTALSADVNSPHFSAYPNPATNFVLLIGNLLPNGNYIIKIINLLGQEEYRSNEVISQPNFQKYISLSNFPNGIYFLLLESANSTNAIKIQKNHF